MQQKIYNVYICPLETHGPTSYALQLSMKTLQQEFNIIIPINLANVLPRDVVDAGAPRKQQKKTFDLT